MSVQITKVNLTSTITVSLINSLKEIMFTAECRVNSQVLNTAFMLLVTQTSNNNCCFLICEKLRVSTHCFELVTFFQRSCSEKCTNNFSVFFFPSVSFTRLVFLVEEWQSCMALMIFLGR